MASSRPRPTWVSSTKHPPLYAYTHSELINPYHLCMSVRSYGNSTKPFDPAAGDGPVRAAWEDAAPAVAVSAPASGAAWFM